MKLWHALIGVALTATVACADTHTPEVKVARSGGTATLTFPEGTLRGTVGWKIHDQTVTARHIRKGKRGAIRWTGPTEVTVDLTKMHRPGHIQQHDAQGAPAMEMWIWGQLADGTQLLQKQSVR